MYPRASVYWPRSASYALEISDQSYSRFPGPTTVGILSTEMSNSSIGVQRILEEIWDLRDRRVDQWPLMNSPLPTVALCSLYFYTVKFLGPWFMKERKPYDLKNTIIVYNFLQVAFSAWLFIKIFFAGWGTTYRDDRGVNFLAT